MVEPPEQPGAPLPARQTRTQRFYASWYWLILRNIIGWLLIVAAFVAGPLVPGPGGIPLFLIGFALISFPGKRRLTARVLRGIPFRFHKGPFVFIALLIALALPLPLLLIAQTRSARLATQLRRGPVAAGVIYLVAALALWTLARLTPHGLNLLLRLIARGRRKFRPWLRRHRIRLLPPRWRMRLGHEAGAGPFSLKEEILKFTHRSKQAPDQGPHGG
ncbi:MAG TPA: hypothetical protein VF669_18890 [Tepidisphaeraceae bacterium]|jgi:hypothetical protein